AAIRMFMQKERVHARTATGLYETGFSKEYVYRKTLERAYSSLEIFSRKRYSITMICQNKKE
ncbi:hypothetical protein LJC58_07515, partial [Lachnospiraceae bacterium OttesenSCG-928-D06]|nr:hypothetical protein [Lachnospiraceae bacterium OttesenSCG-928-D06]